MRESTRLTLLLVVLVASLVWWISQNLLDLDLLSANLSTWLQSVTGYVSPITKNVTNLIDSLFGKLGDRTVWIDYFIKRIIDVVAYVPLALILPLIFFVAGPRRYACWHKLKKVISGRHLDELQDAEEWVNDRYDSAHPSFDFDGRELAEKWSFYGFRTARASPGSTMAQHVASRFHARREQATAILKWVAQHKEGCLHVHVRGDSGDGKSVLLADLAHELRSQSAKNIVLTLKASHGAKAIEDALDWDKLMAYWRLHRPTLWQRWKNSADKQKGSADCFCVILDDFDCRLWKDDGAKEKRNTFLTFHGRLNRKGPKVLLLVTSAETPLNRVKGVLRYPEDRPMDLTEKDERAIFQALVHENPPVLPNLSNLRVEDAWCRGGSVRLHNKNLQAFLDLLFSWDPDTANSIVVTMMQQLTDQSRDPNTGYTLAATRRAQIYVAACQIVGVAVPHGVLECALRAYVNREGAAHPGNRLEEDFSRLCDPIKIDDSHMLRKYSLYAPRIARTLLPRLGISTSDQLYFAYRELLDPIFTEPVQNWSAMRAEDFLRHLLHRLSKGRHFTFCGIDGEGLAGRLFSAGCLSIRAYLHRLARDGDNKVLCRWAQTLSKIGRASSEASDIACQLCNEIIDGGPKKLSGDGCAHAYVSLFGAVTDVVDRGVDAVSATGGDYMLAELPMTIGRGALQSQLLLLFQYSPWTAVKITDMRDRAKGRAVKINIAATLEEVSMFLDGLGLERKVPDFGFGFVVAPGANAESAMRQEAITKFPISEEILADVEGDQHRQNEVIHTHSLLRIVGAERLAKWGHRDQAFDEAVAVIGVFDKFGTDFELDAGNRLLKARAMDDAARFRPRGRAKDPCIAESAIDAAYMDALRKARSESRAFVGALLECEMTYVGVIINRCRREGGRRPQRDSSLEKAVELIMELLGQLQECQPGWPWDKVALYLKRIAQYSGDFAEPVQQRIREGAMDTTEVLAVKAALDAADAWRLLSEMVFCTRPWSEADIHRLEAVAESRGCGRGQLRIIQASAGCNDMRIDDIVNAPAIDIIGVLAVLRRRALYVEEQDGSALCLDKCVAILNAYLQTHPEDTDVAGCAWKVVWGSLGVRNTGGRLMEVARIIGRCDRDNDGAAESSRWIGRMRCAQRRFQRRRVH